jgi:hypothetical protein
MGWTWLRPWRLYANRQSCSTCSLPTHHMAEEQHDGGVFIDSVNFDRGPSCAERDGAEPPLAGERAAKGCMARIVSNHSAFRKRNRKRESLRDVSDCETLRTRLHC